MAMDFPTGPVVGQIVSLGGNQYIWDGTAWNILPQQAPAALSDLPPANPAVGQFWWRATNGQLYVYVNDGNSSQWVQAAGQGITPGLWESIGGLVDLAGLSTKAWQDLSGFRDLRLRTAGIPSGTTGIPFLRVSSNNAVSFDQGASDYTHAHSVVESTTVAGVTSVSATSFPLGNLAFDSQPFEFNITISEWNKAAVTSFDSNGYFGNVVSGARRKQGAYGVRVAANAFDALQLSISAGTFTRGYAILEGVRG